MKDLWQHLLACAIGASVALICYRIGAASSSTPIAVTASLTSHDAAGRTHAAVVQVNSAMYAADHSLHLDYNTSTLLCNGFDQ